MPNLLFLALLFCPAPKDDEGRYVRSKRVHRQFLHATGHPNGWPDHVVDHIIPLKRGGPDQLWNLQWQTVEEAREKDRWE